jgi:hypothetical protein
LEFWSPSSLQRAHSAPHVSILLARLGGQSALVRGQYREVITDLQQQVRHPTVRWMGATLDGRVEATEAVFEAKFMLPWSFSEEAAAEKYMPRLQHNRWVVAARSTVLSVITGGDTIHSWAPKGIGF